MSTEKAPVVSFHPFPRKVKSDKKQYEECYYGLRRWSGVAKRMVVIDGLNIIYGASNVDRQSNNGHPRERQGNNGCAIMPDCLHLLPVVRYFIKRKHAVLVVVPELKLRPNCQFLKNNYVLRALKAIGLLTTTLSLSHDDVAALQIADDRSGVVLTRDKYREHVSAYPHLNPTNCRRVELVFEGHRYEEEFFSDDNSKEEPDAFYERIFNVSLSHVASLFCGETLPEHCAVAKDQWNKERISFVLDMVDLLINFAYGKQLHRAGEPLPAHLSFFRPDDFSAEFEDVLNRADVRHLLAEAERLREVGDRRTAKSSSCCKVILQAKERAPDGQGEQSTAAEAHGLRAEASGPSPTAGAPGSALASSSSFSEQTSRASLPPTNGHCSSFSANNRRRPTSSSVPVIHPIDEPYQRFGDSAMRQSATQPNQMGKYKSATDSSGVVSVMGTQKYSLRLEDLSDRRRGSRFNNQRRGGGHQRARLTDRGPSDRAGESGVASVGPQWNYSAGPQPMQARSQAAPSITCGGQSSSGRAPLPQPSAHAAPSNICGGESSGGRAQPPHPSTSDDDHHQGSPYRPTPVSDFFSTDVEFSYAELFTDDPRRDAKEEVFAQLMADMHLDGWKLCEVLRNLEQDEDLARDHVANIYFEAL